MECPICGETRQEQGRPCTRCGAQVGEVDGGAAPLPSGTPLRSGDFTVTKPLGQGGFGITYRGEDTLLLRNVAIKEVFPTGCVRRNGTVQPSVALPSEDYDYIRGRFLDEARTLARFQHPGIVQVYQAFEENNTAYMVMEFLPGRSLMDLLLARGRAMPELEALRYIEKVCEALEVVHARGLLHRDIKPDNIMVADDGRVVLIDFGTAKEYAQGHRQTQTVMLTPGYAPLEQYARQASRGPFTDVYALAATLYHLLTGQPPLDSMERAAGGFLPQVRQVNPYVSERLSDAVMTGLEMQPDRRPATVAEFWSLLAAAQTATSPTDAAELHERNAERSGERIEERSGERPVARLEPIPTEALNPERRLALSQAKEGELQVSPLSNLTIGGALSEASPISPLLEEQGRREEEPSTGPPSTRRFDPTRRRTAPPPTEETTAVPRTIVQEARPAPPQEKPRVVVVAADGTGDATLLEEALRIAPPGTTVRLRDDLIRLNVPLVIRQSIALEAEEGTHPRIVSTCAGACITLEGEGDRRVRGITFEHLGEAEATVLRVRGGKVEILSCQFTGGQIGLELLGGCRGKVVHCEIRECQGDGVVIDGPTRAVESEDPAALTLEQIVSRDNGGSGVRIEGGAVCLLKDAECLSNGVHGVAIGGAARPQLENGACRENRRSGVEASGGAKPILTGVACQNNGETGISYLGEAGGEARNNTCLDHPAAGIQLDERAAPDLEGNTSRANLVGIAYFGNASGSARSNTCQGNQIHGIQASDEARPILNANRCLENQGSGIVVSGSAAPILEMNQCRNNAEAGITYGENAAGVARRCDCVHNEMGGILVGGQARPTLTGCRCTENIGCGIYFYEQSGGIASNNTCLANGQAGIRVEASANPQLENNQCRDNALD